MKVAFVGLGSMGGPQARLIARGAFELSVFDASPSSMETFRGVARLAHSAADAAEGAAIACVCVRDDRQVEAVVSGAGGLAEGLMPNSLLLVHSTVRIETLKSLANRLAPRGIAVVDAPVTRTRPTDDEPFVLTMLGGDPADTSRVRELVQAFSTQIEEVGPLGAAMALKISNNLVSWVHIVVAGLALELATQHGVSPDALGRVMRANGNLTPPVGGLLDGFHRNPPGTNAEYEAFLASQAGIGEKDLALAIECGAAAGLDTALFEQARKLIRSTMVRNTA